MIDFDDNTIDLELFCRSIKEIKENSHLSDDIIDSFSENQFKSKTKLVSMLQKTEALKNQPEVIIFGSWYGSILIPALYTQSKRITSMDLDEKILKVAKNRLFKNKEKLEFITGDVFEKDLSRYHTCDLFINTSCEHMKPMKDWPYWSYAKPGAFFAFQSNNMFHIPDHINCVNSLEEFFDQLPSNFKVLDTAEINDERGTRFTVVGKII